MYKVTVYNEDGTIEDSSTFKTFEAAFIYKGCAFKLGFPKVTMEEIQEEKQ